MGKKLKEEAILGERAEPSKASVDVADVADVRNRNASYGSMTAINLHHTYIDSTQTIEYRNNNRLRGTECRPNRMLMG